MNIEPIGERVLIKQEKAQEKTSGGIYIPEDAKQQRKEGIVVSVGTFLNGTKLPLQVGDHVIYGGYNSEEITIKGEKHFFIQFKDILGKYN